MDFYRDKTAIVTGAGSGIGRALGRRLAGLGARVVMADIRSDRIEAAVSGLPAAGDRVRAAVLDVTDPEAVRALVEKTAADWDGLDFIFNNAGIAVGGECQDFCLEDWRKVLDVNLYGVIHGVQAAYPLMVKQGRGHIVNTASIEGLVPFPGTASYVGSKHAVVGLSRTLRIEGRDLGVKASAVCPGYIKTAIFEDSELVGIDRQLLLNEIEKRKGMTPAQCAAVILRGVRKNKAVIVVTGAARYLALLQRISPWLVERFMTAIFRRHRKNRGMVEENQD